MTVVFASGELLPPVLFVVTLVDGRFLACSGFADAGRFLPDVNELALAVAGSSASDVVGAVDAVADVVGAVDGRFITASALG